MLGRLREFARALRAGADASVRCEAILRQMLQQRLMAELSATPRFREPLRLLSHGYKVYSEGMEDGILAEIFRRIGVSSRRFVEIGVQDGLECNSAYLLLQGWSGAWIDGAPDNAARARATFASYPVEVLDQFVTAENADALISRLAGEDGLDLLSIDIDSNDYWVWKAVRSVRPRVVVIEYNATLPPHLRRTVAYDPTRFWTGTNFFGASLGALAALGEEKGYRLVGCSPAGVNAFFVRDDLGGDRFCAPFTAENHYEPPRYYLAGPAGHRPGFGEWVEV
jgi:hypothetical protein